MFVILGVIGSVFMPKEEKAIITTTKEIVITTTPEKTTKETSITTVSSSEKKEEWKEIITFEGTEGRTTEVFSIPSNTWRIKWSYKGNEFAVFGFFIYPEGETKVFVDMIMATKPSAEDITYVYRKGNFYLKIDCANLEGWKIVIEAKV